MQAYPNADSARLVLGQFKDDPGAMRDLRSLLDDSATGVQNSTLTEDQVLDAVARLVAGGDLIMAREWPLRGGTSGQEASGSGEDDQPSDPSPSSGSGKSQAPENPSLPSSTDGAAQAAALAAAASSGAPFCEH